MTFTLNTNVVRLLKPPALPNWWDNPQFGDLLKLITNEGKVDRWILTCPACGRQASLSMHKVTENPDGTITVEGSIRCAYATDCDAHYYIQNSKITAA